jgi:hypothetical protein
MIGRSIVSSPGPYTISITWPTHPSPACNGCALATENLTVSLALPTCSLCDFIALALDSNGSVCIINMVPSLPVCDNDSCDRKNRDAQQRMVRELRRQPADTAIARNVSLDESFGEMQECVHCKKTTFYPKFKNCSHCLTVKYWCVLCPIDAFCRVCPSTL